MSDNALTRRSFLKRSAAGAAVVAGSGFVGLYRNSLLYLFYRMCHPVLLLQMDTFEESRILSGTCIVGYGDLCEYLCEESKR